MLLITVKLWISYINTLSVSVFLKYRNTITKFLLPPSLYLFLFLSTPPPSLFLSLVSLLSSLILFVAKLITNHLKASLTHKHTHTHTHNSLFLNLSSVCIYVYLSIHWQKVVFFKIANYSLKQLFNVFYYSFKTLL